MFSNSRHLTDAAARFLGHAYRPPPLVQGKLSYATARKLMDFQSAWARWLPELPNVEIRAAEFAIRPLA